MRNSRQRPSRTRTLTEMNAWKTHGKRMGIFHAMHGLNAWKTHGFRDLPCIHLEQFEEGFSRFSSNFYTSHA